MTLAGPASPGVGELRQVTAQFSLVSSWPIAPLPPVRRSLPSLKSQRTLLRPEVWAVSVAYIAEGVSARYVAVMPDTVDMSPLLSTRGLEVDGLP